MDPVIVSTSPGLDPLASTAASAAAATMAGLGANAATAGWSDSVRHALSLLCLLYYVAITATLLPLSVVPPLRRLLMHGKLLVRESATQYAARRTVARSASLMGASPHSDGPDTDSDIDGPGAAGAAAAAAAAVEPDWLTILLSLRVPKSWFSHFYVVAIAMAAGLAVTTGASWPLFLFACHAARRHWEQRRFFAGSASKMHTGHYLLGLSFYVATPLTIALGVADARIDGTYAAPGFLLTWAFVSSNLAQCMHHYFLSVTPKPIPRMPSVRSVRGGGGAGGATLVRRATTSRSISRPRQPGTGSPGTSTPPRPIATGSGSAMDSGDWSDASTSSNAPPPVPLARTTAASTPAAATGTGPGPLTPRRVRATRSMSTMSTTSTQGTGSHPVVYKLPQRGLFKKVTCPHYLFEISIYAILFLMCPTRTMLACLVWVTANLTVSAHQSHEYYRQMSGKTRRYRIFPGVY
ncbi:hypothetical protein H9P43_000975 [Blastocladiella emersonii ATCC 22665]|nr:hypothetical protein H9P43_000975 [Blastocladiella emersonii ATCC 22665]